jgi:hypothetical protein
MPRLSRSTSSLLGLGIVEIVTACAGSVADAVEIIEHLAPKARRIPSRSWRELIKNVWEVDPLLCPQCQHEMRIVSLINDAQIIEPWLDDPMPDDDCGI